MVLVELLRLKAIEDTLKAEKAGSTLIWPPEVMHRPGLSSFSIDALMGHHQPRLSSVLPSGYMFLPGTALLPHQALAPFHNGTSLHGSLAPNPLAGMSPPFAHGGMMGSHSSASITQPLSVSIHSAGGPHGGSGTGVHGAFRAYNPLVTHLRGGLGLQPKTGELLPAGLGHEHQTHHLGLNMGRGKEAHEASPRAKSSSISPVSRHDSSHSDGGKNLIFIDTRVLIMFVLCPSKTGPGPGPIIAVCSESGDRQAAQGVQKVNRAF